MAGGVRDRSRQDRGVEHEHRAGDAGHAAGHDDEHFAPRELGQIGPDEQRRLDLADKNIGRRGEPGGAADVERLFQRPGKAAHDGRHDAPVEQQRRQHAHHQHHRQRLEAENELRRRRLDVERRRRRRRHSRTRRRCRRASASATASTARLIQSNAISVCGTLSISNASAKVTPSPVDHRPPRHRAAVLAERKGERENGEHAQRRLQVWHFRCSPDFPRGSLFVIASEAKQSS